MKVSKWVIFGRTTPLTSLWMMNKLTILSDADSKHQAVLCRGHGRQRSMFESGESRLISIPPLAVFQKLLQALKLQGNSFLDLVKFWQFQFGSETIIGLFIKAGYQVGTLTFLFCCNASLAWVALIAWYALRFFRRFSGTSLITFSVLNKRH